MLGLFVVAMLFAAFLGLMLAYLMHGLAPAIGT